MKIFAGETNQGRKMTGETVLLLSKKEAQDLDNLVAGVAALKGNTPVDRKTKEAAKRLQKAGVDEIPCW